MPYLKKAALFFLVALFYHVAEGQVITADSLYSIGRYQQACEAYFNDFKLNPQDTTDDRALYDAARSCAKIRYNDSAYRYLFMIADDRAIKYFDEILYGTAFKNIWKDKRWDALTLTILKNKHDFNASVSIEFTELGRQRLAVEYGKDSVLNRDGRNFKLIEKYTDSIRTIDSINNLKFKTIINTYGWMGPGNVSKAGFRWLIYLYKKLPIATQKIYFSFIANDFKARQLAPTIMPLLLTGSRCSIPGNRSTVHRPESRLKMATRLM